MMYKKWKKLLLALTAFFWNACDNNSSPTVPVHNPDSSSSATDGVSSSDEVSSSSSEVSSSSFDVQSSSSRDFVPVPLYGVLMGDVCTKVEGDSTLVCSDGVKCVESVADVQFAPRNEYSEVTAKYGIVYVRNKTYKCDDGKVYNEAEFREHYDVITSIPDKKIPCYKDRVDEFVDCEDGNTFSFGTDENGNKTYVGPYAEMTEKEFLDKYEIFEQKTVLYGPPCVFDGTCGEDK